MGRHHKLTIARLIGSLCLALMLVGCATSPDISTDVEYCCKAPRPDIHTYRIEFANMPEFLKPMLRDEVAIVLDRKGLEYTEGDAHAVLKLTYVHNLLPNEAPDTRKNTFAEPLPAGGNARFLAEVDVEMRDAVSADLLWSGRMVRAHNVPMGAYMHDAPAREAIRKAFAALFADYPVGDFNE